MSPSKLTDPAWACTKQLIEFTLSELKREAQERGWTAATAEEAADPSAVVPVLSGPTRRTRGTAPALAAGAGDGRAGEEAGASGRAGVAAGLAEIGAGGGAAEGKARRPTMAGDRGVVAAVTARQEKAQQPVAADRLSEAQSAAVKGAVVAGSAKEGGCDGLSGSALIDEEKAAAGADAGELLAMEAADVVAATRAREGRRPRWRLERAMGARGRRLALAAAPGWLRGRRRSVLAAGPRKARRGGQRRWATAGSWLQICNWDIIITIIIS
ncbi:unnamed protein product [Linum trigynum]|uniref:Uncharacterized protein n=1 Tax=Linum trigynum TaxID=586398 RepID=A0AAV2GMV7_9ROSI